MERILTGFLFALAIAALSLPGFLLPALPILMIAAVAVICMRELADALSVYGLKPLRFMSLAGAACVAAPLLAPLVHGDPGWRLLARSAPDAAFLEAAGGVRSLVISLLATGYAAASGIMLMLVMASIMGVILKEGPKVLLDAVATSAMIMYIAFPLSCLVLMLVALPDGYLWMLAAMAVSWVTDVTAFFAGSFFGRHKIVPAISPKKTWEGGIGGAIGGMLVMTAWFLLFMRSPFPDEAPSTVFLLATGAVTGFLCSASAQLGDWFASAVKRFCGVKDFGTVLPGHGGVLDRFDSVLFSAPTLLLCALVFYIVR